MDLHGHTSPDTAYVVADYPYGFKERCRIRFWIERDLKRGWRFCSQTENPKKLKWNAPKRSTYTTVAAAMCLQDGKVKWDRLSTFCSGADAAEFVRRHPGADLSCLKEIAASKVRLLRKLISGEAVFLINGKSTARSEAQLLDDKQELEAWLGILGG